MENPFRKNDNVYSCGNAFPYCVQQVSPSDTDQLNTCIKLPGVNLVKDQIMWISWKSLSFTPFELGDHPNHVRPSNGELHKYYEFSHDAEFEYPVLGAFIKVNEEGKYVCEPEWPYEFMRPIPPSKIGK